MKHIELIELLYRRKEIINDAFIGHIPNEIPEDLLDSGIFRKIGKEYKLSDNYKQFANALLKRVDANYTFGDYIEEHKRLIKYKNDFEETKDNEYIRRIISQIKILYEKFQDRDIQIEFRIAQLINDNDLNIDVVIRDAEDVLERIDELIKAGVDNRKILHEIRGLDNEIDELLTDFSIDLMPLTENIHIYIERLRDFILRTQKRKEQNNKLVALSNKILHEKDINLEAILRSNKNTYKNIPNNKGGFITALPSESDIDKEKFLLETWSVLMFKGPEKKKHSSTTYKKKEPVVEKTIDLSALNKDIANSKPGDVYKFIYSHKEISKFSKNEHKDIQAFKAYLTIITSNRNNISFKNQFNEHNIRIAEWM